jgi:hypothetical protein
MNKTDKGRKWMWWFLGTATVLQLYFVRELLVALALFAALFAVLATAAVGLYMLQKGWELAVVRVAESNHPAVATVRRSVNSLEDMARRGVSAADDLAHRPLRRAGSASAR